jgi:hypothetical protein
MPIAILVIQMYAESKFEKQIKKGTAMDDHFLRLLMRQRQEQMIAEVRAARACQLEWQHKIRRILNILPSFIKDRKIPISNQAPIVSEGNRS